MIRLELAEKLSGELKVTEKKAGEIINAFCNAVKKGLQKDGKVMIQNFAVFEMRPLAARVSYNAHSGIHFNLPARTRIWFRPAKDLNAFINNGAVKREN